MKTTRWISALTLCILAMPGPARAALTQDSFLLRNTGDLIDLCSAPPNDPLYTAAVNFCHGFVVGVVRVLNEENMARRSGRMFCLPEPPPSRNEGIAEFVQWAKAMPSELNRQPAEAVAAFLAQRFPCTNPTPSRGAVR